MLRVSNEFKQDKNRNIEIEIKGTFGDVDFAFSYEDLLSVKYTGNCMTNERFNFGAMSACALDFTLENGNGKWDDWYIKNSILEANMIYTKEDSTKEEIPLGIFKVSKAKKNVSSGTIVVESEDSMMAFNKKWEEKDTEAFKEGTVRELEKYMCEQLGEKVVTCSSENIPCNYLLTEKTVKKFKGKTYRSLLNWCGEIRGGYAIINRFGELEMREFNANKTPVIKIARDDLLECEFETQEVVVNSINLLKYSKPFPPRPNLNCTDLQINLNKNNLLISGLLYEGERHEVVEHIANNVAGLRFMPGKIKCVGNPALEVGDIVSVEGKNNKWYNVIVTSLTLENNLTMTISCVGPGDENYDDSGETVIDDMQENINNSGLPDMSGHAGSVLRTDGTNAFWGVNCGVVKVKPAKTYTSIGWCRVTKSVRKLEKEEWENLRGGVKIINECRVNRI